MAYVVFPYSFKEQMTLGYIARSSPYGVFAIVGGMGQRMSRDLEKKERDLCAHHTKIVIKLM